MEVIITNYKRCDVISIIGRVDSRTAPQLQEETQKVTNAGKYKLVFDMSKVEFLSSAGLRILIQTQKECKRYNRGEVLLAEVPPKIYSSLDLAGFTALFQFHKTVIDAVAAF
jgi:anti-sigma B factor antagonist